MINLLLIIDKDVKHETQRRKEHQLISSEGWCKERKYFRYSDSWCIAV